MSVSRTDRVSWLPLLWVAGLLLAGAVIPASARAGEVTLTGRVVDADQRPVAGYRVVYREVSSFEVYLAEPTDVDGRFSVTVPADGSYVAVALLSSRGGRLELGTMPPIEGVAGTHQQIQVSALTAMGLQPEIQRFPGGDRLYVSFAEDTAVVGRLRLEAQMEGAEFKNADRVAVRAIAAYQFAALEDVELGGRAGFGDLDVSGSSGSRSGATDLDLWLKLRVGSESGVRPDLSFGAVVTLPTGDDDAGLGAGALSSKLFVAARHSFRMFPDAVFAAHLGVRGTENGRILGVPVEGKTSGAAGLALIWPLAERLTLIVEAAFEGKRFEVGDSDSRLLAGVNWKPLPYGSFRLAASFGLADGAPDSQFLAGYSFDF